MKSIPAHIRTNIDIFSDEILSNPYPFYKQMQNIGPVSYLDKYDVWYSTRYEQVRSWGRDWETFSSDKGIGLNDKVNEAWNEALICEDPPIHTEKRKFLNQQLSPVALEPIKEVIAKRSEELVTDLINKGTVDAVKDIAQDLPIKVVMDLIGWPKYVREQLIELAAGSFNALGPLNNSRTTISMNAIDEITKVAEEVFDNNDFEPGSWGEGMANMAKKGNWTKEAACGLLQGYIVAAFDTTIYGISSGIWLFAENPEQWDMLRENPDLANKSFTEILRLETPLQHVSRVTTKDVNVGEGITIPKGDRVLLSWAAGNRDERVFENPAKFEINRKSTPSMGFGIGIHTCAGQGLARMEANGIFQAMAKRIKGFETIEEPKRDLNNIARGFRSVPIKIIT